MDVVARARELYREWDVAALPVHLQRNSFDHYYLSIWPGLGQLTPVADLDLPPRPSTVRYAYVHIPFCSGICDFCSYVLTTTHDAGADARVDAYLDRVLDQLRLHRRDTTVQLSSLYLGGGTPGILTPAQLARLLDTMRSLGVFAAGMVGTMELHPELFADLDRLDRVLEILAGHGIRRVSLGYQSSQDTVLEVTGRRHGAAFLPAAAAQLRSRGFLFNVDLMYGLPGQSVTTWASTVADVLAVEPDSISTYFTFVDYGTSLWRQARRRPSLLSTTQDAQLCHLVAQVALETAGYHELPNDFWARPTTDPTEFVQQSLPSQHSSLALGAGAYGYYPGVQYFNEISLAGYGAAVAAGRVPVWRAAVLSPAEEFARDIMFSFKNSPLLSRPLFRARHGAEPVTAYPQQFDELRRLDLVAVTDEAVRLTPKGRLLVEEISCLFAVDRPQGTVSSRVEENLVRKHHFAPTYGLARVGG